MKQLLAVGKASDQAKEVFSYLEKFFGIQVLEQSLDGVAGIVTAMRPDMVLVSVEELLASPTEAMGNFISANPGLSVATFGTPDDFTRFSKMYTGDPIQNINLPLDEEACLFLICSTLKISMKKLKAESANKKTVLVVDDDATTLRSIKSILENKYNVELANSAAKAFEIMEKKVPDLILLDYEMPVMNGKEMLEKVRATSQYAHLPVIFVTSMTDKTIISSLIPLRPSGYLLKPITMDVLNAEVEKVLK